MDSVKVDYSVHDRIQVYPVVGFDWYATGYCISHFDERWGLDIRDYNMGMEGIDLPVKGHKSSPVAKRRIRYLHLSLSSLFFSQVMTPLREFCELHDLMIFIYHCDHDRDDEAILQQLIAPGSELRRLKYKGELHTDTLIPLFFQPSSLQELILKLGYEEAVLHHKLLPCENTKLKKLTISRNLLRPLAAFIVNITSLTYLESDSVLQDSDLPVLTNIVQSHYTLEVLNIGLVVDHYASSYPSTNILQLIEVAGKSQLKKLRLNRSDYDKLPPHIHEQYKHLLESY